LEEKQKKEEAAAIKTDLKLVMKCLNDFVKNVLNKEKRLKLEQEQAEEAEKASHLCSCLLITV